ncbi:unnamed protein product [Candidula unifasciata]|uniref:Chaoptin n=1 Tax=Candidula unifasciata TaxID=100452 RepID=A0A8S3YSW5_9EUPU|nr:unnamed protein product [Candidula unifasciata]
MNLAVPLMLLITSAAVASMHRPLCPSACQCSSQYYVYCQDMEITDLQLAEIISGVSSSAVLLDLSSNHITRIQENTFTSLPNLEYLYLSANSITELSNNAFLGLPKLRELTLNDNGLDVVNSRCFSELSQLKDLNMENNLIKSLPEGLFRNLASLQNLQLQKNHMTALQPNQFSGLTNLRLLNLSHNSLTSIAGSVFSGLRSVIHLSLMNNNLNLILDKNNISDLVFMHGNDFYLSLNFVSIADNNIEYVPSHVFPHNANIKHIDLSGNRIRRIGGHAFNSLHLESVNLQKNNISEVNKDIFKDARRILHLNLRHNKIQNIFTGAFDSIRDNIINVDLQFNQLSYLHPGMFRGMRRLRTLNLAANGIFLILILLNLSMNLFIVLSSETISGPAALRRLLIVCNPLQKLVGFSYEDVNDRIFIESNSTMISSTPTSVLITWPYKEGTQLYWTLSVNCVNQVACEVPHYESTLRPYISQVIVAGLRPGAEYFICVTPVFLSSEVNISQCAHVRTQLDSLNDVRHSTDPDAQTNDPVNNSSSIFDIIALYFLVVIAHGIMHSY